MLLAECGHSSAASDLNRRPRGAPNWGDQFTDPLHVTTDSAVEPQVINGLPNLRINNLFGAGNVTADDAYAMDGDDDDDGPGYRQQGQKEYQQQQRRKRRQGRIISGRETEEGEFPWQVSLQLLHPVLGFIGHWCGGVLIHRKWIISAAHCVHK